MKLFGLLAASLLLSLSISHSYHFPVAEQIEVCNNALDDDADGLTDLNDPDCDCPVAEPISRIPNPSFEEQDCCPTGRSQMNCATGWIQASTPTTDYLHTCNWLGWPGLPPPLPFPDGEGCMGFRNGRPDDITGNGPQPNWKEYAGACLTAPLRAGIAYRFEFHIGFTNPLNSPPTNIVFFGSTDCSNLPFGNGAADFGCPTNGPGWVQLGSVPINGFNEWKLKEINIIPSENIYAIVIGPDCRLMPSDLSTYYFFDELVLAEELEFSFRVTAQNHPCSDNFELLVPYYDTLQYQWYRDGIALVGETRAELKGPREEGNYQIRALGPNSCRLTSVYRHRAPTEYAQIQETICQGETYLFNTTGLQEGGIFFDTLKTINNCDSIVRLELEVIGQAADTTYAKIFEGESWPVGNKAYSEPGQYDIILTSAEGCDSLVHLVLDTYSAYIPTAFSPNGDGRNDHFTIFAAPDIKEASLMQVFDRWGSLVFEAKEQPLSPPFRGWDGQISGQPAPTGLYAYQAILVTDDGGEHLVKGEVLLVR